MAGAYPPYYLGIQDNSRANTLIPVVAGGDLNSVRLFGNYDTYGRQNQQIQLISGATLTENGRSASKIDPAGQNYLNNVSLQYRGFNPNTAFLNPATVSAGDAYMPSSPQDVKVTYAAASNGDPSKTDATVTWDAPRDDGNSELVAYQIAYLHSGNVQFFITTDVSASGEADLTLSPNSVPYWYSGYSYINQPANGSVNGATRIYTVNRDSAAYAARSFTFRNVPVGFEAFFRVRAISDIRNSIDLDGTEEAGNNSFGATHNVFNENLTIRTSGRGAWGLYNGGRSEIVPAVK
jgi:hypothetical protein